jgi:hypothetical protein
VGVSLKVGLSRRKAEHEVSDHKEIFDEAGPTHEHHNLLKY